MPKFKKSQLVVLGILVLAVLVMLFGNMSFTKTPANLSSASDQVDELAKNDINNVLWQKKGADISASVSAEKLAKITPKKFGEETQEMLQNVKTAFLPLVQRYPERYNLLSTLAEKGLTTNQAYNIGDVMGQDYYKGFDGMKSIKKLEFPRDYSAHKNFQVGWYFFASSFKDQKGNDVDVLVNFFRRAIYPPDIAEKMGLSQMDNQMVEMQLGLSLADKNIHIQGSDPVVSGKTGLVELNTEPFLIKLGKNEVKSVNPNSLFPLTINVYDPEKNLKIDLTLEETKPIFLEGDNGKVPSMYNLGTWYYSMPSIKTTGTINYSGDVRKVTGKTWFDNQWTAGIMPAGYPDNWYIRSLANITNGLKNTIIQPWGWDWTEVQLDNNIDVTLAAMHSVKSDDLKNLGDTPPATANRDVTGKMINPDGSTEDISGTMQITEWQRSPASKAWYPNKWIVQVPSKNLEYTMTPTANGQIFQAAPASEFREGGVDVVGKMDGKEITGIGFGEGTGYAGEDYTNKTMFDILGIDNTQANRTLFAQPVPGVWLVIQSLLLYAVSLVLAVWILICLYFRFFKHPAKNKSVPKDYKDKKYFGGTMDKRKLYVVAASLAFLAALFFYIGRDYSTGALWTVMGILFVSLYSK